MSMAEPAMTSSVPTPNPLLEQLHDFHAPESIGYWPPAPGWIVLALLLLALLIWLGRWLWQRHRNNAWRRIALARLAELRRQPPDPDNAQQQARISQLLKQCLASRLVDQPEQARRIMTLSGTAFAELLAQSSRALSPYDIELFAHQQYRPVPPALEPGHWQRIELWIRSLPA
jgi:hypothetical protein